MPKDNCSVDGCGAVRVKRGWCSRHYQRWRRLGDPTASARRATIAERFDAKVTVDPASGCWEWTAMRMAAGYGVFFPQDRKGGKRDVVLAHRWSYARVHGPISTGLSVCHRCDNPPCVNPAHLFVGTPPTIPPT